MAVKPLDFELTGDGELPAVSARYQDVCLLVRLLGRPIAALDVENSPGSLQRSRLVYEIASKLAPKIWVELALDEQPLGSPDVQAPPPAIAAVVCTRDRSEQLEGCLGALAVQTHPCHEVIVVDNGSTDDRTHELAERYGCRYVLERRPGLDWARNRGISEARHPLVAFTDDDARPDPDWLANLAAGFTSDDVAAVTGLVAPAELETQAQQLFERYGGMGKGYETTIFSQRFGRVRFRPHIYGVGCNMAFRKQVLQDLRAFDPALDVGTLCAGGGDLDVFQRLIEARWAIVYRPHAVVRHTHRRMIGQLRRQVFDNGRGYCAAGCAALGRARGLDRVRIGYDLARWLWSWHIRRIVRRLLGRGQLPLSLYFAELRGALVGPFCFAAARRRARRLAQE